MTWPQYYIGCVSERCRSGERMRTRCSRGSAWAVWECARTGSVWVNGVTFPVLCVFILCECITCRVRWQASRGFRGNECVTIHQMESDISILSEHAHIGRQLGGIWVAIFGHRLRAAVSASMPRETMSFAIIYRSDGEISRQRTSLAFQSISRPACVFSIGFPVKL